MELKVYKDKQQVAAEFSAYLVKQIESNDRLNVALSGGSTPKVVFDYLAEHYKDIDWDKVHFFWGDERCVPPTHVESNYKMTVDHLLKHISIPEENIHRVKGEGDPAKEAERYSSELKQSLPLTNGMPQFDLVILGMGSDGHTASIFPHQMELWNSKNLTDVAEHPETGQKRITLTGQVINNAKEVAFLVTGADKKEKVSTILSGTGESNQYPAALVAPESGQLVWFLDEEAYGQKA